MNRSRNKFRAARLGCILSFFPLSPRGAPAPEAVRPVPPRAPDSAEASGGNWLASLLRRPFDPNPDLEMTVITEMTDAGRKLPPVSREHPAYYQDESSGDREMGGIVAHEQTMPPEEVRPLLVRGLATNGFQPAQMPEHPPSLMVFYFWGTHNAIDPEIAALSPNQRRRNILDRAALVGGRKFSDELATVMQDTEDGGLGPPVKFFIMRKPDNEALLRQALGDVFYVVASAFDYQSVAKGHPVLLWRTRMTVSSQGVQMKRAIPAIVAGAGKYFGREMTEPALLHHRDPPEGQVEIGTATVVKTPPAPPVSDKK